jgi:plasmid stabilization system protein ParE
VVGYEYHPAAQIEYFEAIHYYSRIRLELGMSFVTEVESAIQRARQFPEAYGKVSSSLRHVGTHRFPYAIIYEILGDRFFIWAVAHTSREPGYWKARA